AAPGRAAGEYALCAQGAFRLNVATTYSCRPPSLGAAVCGRAVTTGGRAVPMAAGGHDGRSRWVAGRPSYARGTALASILRWYGLGAGAPATTGGALCYAAAATCAG